MEHEHKLSLPGVATKRTCFVHVQPDAGELDTHICPVLETFSPQREYIFAEPVRKDLTSACKANISHMSQGRLTVYPGQTWPMYRDPSGFLIHTSLRCIHRSSLSPGRKNSLFNTACESIILIYVRKYLAKGGKRTHDIS